MRLPSRNEEERARHLGANFTRNNIRIALNSRVQLHVSSSPGNFIAFGRNLLGDTYEEVHVGFMNPVAFLFVISENEIFHCVDGSVNIFEARRNFS